LTDDKSADGRLVESVEHLVSPEPVTPTVKGVSASENKVDSAAPLCYNCGNQTQRAGSCYVCSSCGSTTGCS